MATPKNTLANTKNERADLLRNEWHPTKNQDINPAAISIQSKDKFWWKCELGHDWYAAMQNRYRAKAGCHVCTGKVILAGFNDLASIFPDVAAEWHPTLNLPLTADSVSARSGTPVSWQCKTDDSHVWEAKIANRTKEHRPTGCPYCTNQKVLTGINDLETLYPEIAAEWDTEKNGKPASQSFARTNKFAFWLGKNCGHSWDMRISDRTLSGDNCPYCSGSRVLEGLNDFASLTEFSHILAEWDYEKNTLLPTQITRGTSTMIWWKCGKDHSWDMSVKNRVRGYNCPVCSGRRLIVGINDLATMNPELAKEWHPTKNDRTPQNITAGSGYKAWWQCEKDHAWFVSICDRNNYETNCPSCFCSGISKAELEMADFIASVLPQGVEMLQSVRSVISPLELDVYVSALQLAFEFNGVYWHSEAAGKGKGYHFSKFSQCRDQGIQLIQVWEDDWLNRRDVVKSMIHRKINEKVRAHLPFSVTVQTGTAVVYARATQVDSHVTYQEAKLLLDAHHMRGAASGSHYIGLRAESSGDLVAVMVLKKKTSEIVDLSRFATAVDVPGGFAKLLSWVGEHLPYSQIETFLDNEISDGKLYADSGFSVSGTVKPDYKYVVGLERKHKFLFRKSRFQSDPNLFFDPDMTEFELASENGFARAFDSGKVKWAKSLAC